MEKMNKLICRELRKQGEISTIENFAILLIYVFWGMPEHTHLK